MAPGVGPILKVAIAGSNSRHSISSSTMARLEIGRVAARRMEGREVMVGRGTAQLNLEIAEARPRVVNCLLVEVLAAAVEVDSLRPPTFSLHMLQWL